MSFRNVEERSPLPGAHDLKRARISLRANRPWWVFASNIFLMWGAFFFQTGAPGVLLPLLRREYRADGGYRRISTFVPCSGTLTVPLLARRMKNVMSIWWPARSICSGWGL
ncbi:hypothetical protein J4733_20890 [Klebsiella pneumoniae]|uniref:Uncharacterized protein n=1 Tax=Klebsiella pneumoniae TaxID=573 RepID=A0A939SPN3_KLEPN|nr:hypothetical protein [Klebsiella pneumoniae]